MVAVEASPGHDIGIVTLTGKLVLLQMKKNNIRTGEGYEPKKVYRKAKPTDIEKYEEAKAKEQDVYKRQSSVFVSASGACACRSSELRCLM